MANPEIIGGNPPQKRFWYVLYLVILISVVEGFSQYNIKSTNKNFEWACGCQYQVPVKMIKNKTLLWWIDLYRIHYYFSVDRNNDLLSYVIESIFPIILDYNQKGY